MTPQPTMRRAVTDAAAALGAAGCDQPRLDARLLLAHATARRLEDQIRAPEAPLTPAEAARFRAAVDRRVSRVPVAQITGEKEFWSLPLAVTPDVLVPRPESEVLVEHAVTASNDRALARPRVLDLGTGSGCLLLAVLTELPRAVGLGVDVSNAAVAVARRNATRLGLGSRTRFAVADWRDGVPGRYDLVLANPPYIPTAEIAALGPELAHEPRTALDGGADGLAAFRHLVPALRAALAPGGIAMIEFGEGQAAAVAALAAAAGLRRAGIGRDLSGIERCLGLRPESPLMRYEKRLGNRVLTE